MCKKGRYARQKGRKGWQLYGLFVIKSTELQPLRNRTPSTEDEPDQKGK
jgi:hypothetical protein